MKKLLLGLLVVVMLISAASVLAEEPVEKSNVVNEFLKETDFENQDIALQSQSGDNVSDLVIRVDGNNLHLVARNDDVEESHIQLNPTGIYVDDKESVTLLRYSTVNTIVQEFSKNIELLLEEVVKNLPEVSQNDLPTEAEVMNTASQMANIAAKVEAQEEADAIVLHAAAMSFAGKFKPEYILEVKEDDGSVEIGLRAEAFAAALGEAVDELMSNPDLAKVIDRQAALEGKTSFTEMQLEWQAHREEILESIRTVESSEYIDEDGRYESHFQIGEESSTTKILVCDSNAQIDAEAGDAEANVSFGFKDEDPILVYEFEMDPYYYWEKMSFEDSRVEINLELDEGKITEGEVVSVIEGKEYLTEQVGPDYLYLKGPNGGISTSVRETWTGKTRYELVAESADGQEASITVDFYEDFDSLVCELYTSESDESVKFMMSRVDKLTIDDLRAAKNLKEITVEDINTEVENALKPVVNYLKPFVEANSTETAPAN